MSKQFLCDDVGGKHIVCGMEYYFLSLIFDKSKRGNVTSLNPVFIRFDANIPRIPPIHIFNSFLMKSSGAEILSSSSTTFL